MSAVDPSPPSPEPTALSFPISGRPDLGRAPWADHRDPSLPAPADPSRIVPAEPCPPPRLRWDLRSTVIRDHGVPYTFSIPLEGAALDYRAGQWIARRVNTLYAQTFSTAWALVLVAPARPGQRLLVLATPDLEFGVAFDDDQLRRHLDDALKLLITVGRDSLVGASRVSPPGQRVAR